MDGPPLAFLLMFVGAAMPSLAALLLTRLLYGRQGMRGLGARLCRWRVGRWWLTLLILPVLVAVTPLLRRLAGYPVDTRAMIALLVPGLALGIGAGLSEEIGWRGFLLPHLLKRYSPLVAALLVGLIWGGLWHGYANYFGLGDRGAAFWPLVLLLGPGVLTARSLVQTRVHQGTQGSLLMAILVHAAGSGAALIFGQTYGSIHEELAWTAISTGVMLLGAVLIWVWLGKTLGKASAS
jgi:membrane protease YdiL (CAAX protease family)